MDKGFIRIRQHGTIYTFEFTKKAKGALDSIYNFSTDKGLGNFSGLYISHLNSNGSTIDSTNIKWKEFKENYKKDKKLILKTAKEDNR